MTPPGLRFDSGLRRLAGALGLALLAAGCAGAIPQPQPQDRKSVV